MGLAFSDGRWELNFYFAAIVLILLLSGVLPIILGFVLCYLGLSGHFEFTAELHGIKFAIAAVSPGLGVALCGPAMWYILGTKVLEKLIVECCRQSSGHGDSSH